MAAPTFTLKVGDGLGAHIGVEEEFFAGATAILEPNIKDGDVVPVDGKLRTVEPVVVTLDANGKINGNTGVDLLADDPSLGLDNPLQWKITVRKARARGFSRAVREWSILAGSSGDVVDLAQVPPVVGVPAVGSRGPRTHATLIASGPDAGKAQWVDEYGVEIGDPVPWDQVVSSEIATTAAEAVAPGVVDADLASRDLGVSLVGGGTAVQWYLGPTPIGEPYTTTITTLSEIDGGTPADAGEVTIDGGTP